MGRNRYIVSSAVTAEGARLVGGGEGSGADS